MSNNCCLFTDFRLHFMPCLFGFRIEKFWTYHSRYQRLFESGLLIEIEQIFCILLQIFESCWFFKYKLFSWRLNQKKTGKRFQLKVETIIEGSSDHLLLVDVQILFKIYLYIVPKGSYKGALGSKNLNLRLILSISIYKVNYEDQIFLSWPNWSACQFSWQSNKVDTNFNYKN